MKGDLPLSLGIPVIFGGVLILICLIYKNKWGHLYSGDYHCMRITFVLGIIAIGISSNIFPWVVLSKLDNFVSEFFLVIQFPWRYLSFATLFMTFATLSALRIMLNIFGNQVKIYAMIAFASAIAIVDGNFFVGYMNVAEEIRTIQSTSYYSDLLYLPEGSSWPISSEALEVSGGNDTIIAEFIDGNQGIKKYTVYNDGIDTYIDLPIYYYDNLTVNDGETQFVSEKAENNRLRVYVPKGYKGMIEISYEVPFMWKLSNLVSGFVVIWVLAYWLFERRKYKIGKGHEYEKKSI